MEYKYELKEGDFIFTVDNKYFISSINMYGFYNKSEIDENEFLKIIEDNSLYHQKNDRFKIHVFPTSYKIDIETYNRINNILTSVNPTIEQAKEFINFFEEKNKILIEKINKQNIFNRMKTEKSNLKYNLERIEEYKKMIQDKIKNN